MEQFTENTENLEIGNLIGTGFFSEVFNFKNHQKLAIKIVKINIVGNRKYQNEVNIMKMLNHENVVRMISNYQSKIGNCIVMEYCENGNLSEVYMDFDQQRIQSTMSQIFCGLQYIHSNLIVHRDIKLENILISGNKVKIADFDLSVKLEDENQKISEIAGTMDYLAPEVLNGEYSFSADIWASCVLLYFLENKEVPFAGKNAEVVFKRIANIDYVNGNYIFSSIYTRVFISDVEMRPNLQKLNELLYGKMSWLQMLFSFFS